MKEKDCSFCNQTKISSKNCLSAISCICGKHYFNGKKLNHKQFPSHTEDKPYDSTKEKDRIINNLLDIDTHQSVKGGNILLQNKQKLDKTLFQADFEYSKQEIGEISTQKENKDRVINHPVKLPQGSICNNLSEGFKPKVKK